MKRLAILLLALGAAAQQTPRVVTVESGRLTRELRVAGVTTAVHGYVVRVPQIPGQSQQFTLLTIAASGSMVKPGDPLAQFDDTSEVQNARDAKAKFDDLSHQVDNQIAQNNSSAEQRASDLQQAESDLAKAQLELKKAPIQSSIDAQTDQLNLEDATAHVASLKRENALKDQADAATLQGLKLQQQQQKVEMDRAQAAVAKLHVTAPLAGMVGLVAVFRQSGQGPAQPGDQLYSNNAIVRIFDPAEMAVAAQINEADGASLTPGLKGTLHLDAYPGSSFPVHLETASPVAVASPGIPVRTFAARFRVDASDPRLLPDLSSAIDLHMESPDGGVLAPRRAVHFTQGEPYVSKQAAGGSWTEQRVELGSFNDQQVVVVSGLRPGDRIRLPTGEAGGAP